MRMLSLLRKFPNFFKMMSGDHVTYVGKAGGGERIFFKIFFWGIFFYFFRILGVTELVDVRRGLLCGILCRTTQSNNVFTHTVNLLSLLKGAIQL